jgi:predicted ABC-type ATPase
MSELVALHTKTFHDKIGVSSPKLIITYGPPASGKGYITEHLLMTQLKLTHASTIEINIDSIVSKLSGYIKEVQNCIQYYSSVKYTKDIKMEQMKKCSDIYNKYRFNALPNSTETADDSTKKILLTALDKKLNIIYETTGNSITWTIDPVIHEAKKNNYEIIIIYPIVDNEIIKRRLLSRAKKEGRYLSPSIVNEMVEKSQKNIKDLLPYCNEILVYDNNCTPKLIADIYNKAGVIQAKCVDDNQLYEFLDSKQDEFVKFIDDMCHRKAQVGGNKPSHYYIKYEN